jgi:hypothetical protein
MEVELATHHEGSAFNDAGNARSVGRNRSDRDTGNWPVKDGGVLLSAHVEDPDEVQRAKHALQARGTEDVASSGEARGRAASNTESVPRHT